MMKTITIVVYLSDKESLYKLHFSDNPTSQKIRCNNGLFKTIAEGFELLGYELIYK